MSLTIACSACRKQLALPEGLLGQLVSCPGCHHAFTVIDEAGRLSIHVQGSERAIPAIPVNYDDIPTVLPAPPRAPYVPGARAPRPFVFRVFVIEDPDNRVDGSMHARISASGLELRDKRDLVYRISPGCESRYLGRNVFEVTLDGKPIKIRVIQRACQQCRLAEDIVLFLTQKRSVPRLKDYRPRLAPRLLAWSPLLAAMCILPFGIAGWIGAGIWLTLGLIVSFVGWLLIRNESRPLKARWVRVGAAWCFGLLMLCPLVPLALHLRDEYQPPPLTWRDYNNGIFFVQMPGTPKHDKRPLFNAAGAPLCDLVFANVPAGRGTYEAWSYPSPIADFQEPQKQIVFKQVTSLYIQANPDSQANGSSPSLHRGVYPSEECRFYKFGHSETLLRIILTKHRVYVVRITRNRSEPQRQETLRFSASFSLILTHPENEAPMPLVAPDLGKFVKEKPAEKRNTLPWTPTLPRWRIQWVSPKDMKGLIGYWPLDEGKGTQTKDVTGKGPSGTVSATSWTSGINGNAVMFDGKAPFLDFGKTEKLTFPKESAFTVAFWVATKDATGPLLTLGNSSKQGEGIRIGMRDSFLHARVKTAATDFKLDEELAGQPVFPSINDARWHHLALVRSEDGAIKLYRDGSPVGDIIRQSNTDALAIDGVTMGSEWNGMGLPGPQVRCVLCCDELCIFNRALTGKEIMILTGRK